MTARRFLLAALLAAPAGAGEVAPESHGLHKLRAASAAAAEPAPPSAFQARLKWFTAGTALPKNDAARRALGDAAPFRHNADLRLMWRRDLGGLRLTAEHAVTALRDRALGFGGISALTLEQTPAADAGRLLDLAWTVDEGSNARLSHRFDRLAIEYRASRWAVTAGRQAVSWGAGLVFQPMDLLSPFAPTTVDVDYKPGDDLVLVERLFESGADLQLLAVGRRAPGGAVRDASSVAAKYRGSVGANEFELMIARHRAENVFAVGLRAPIGGALLRSDIVLAEGEGGTAVSAVLNADYTVAVAGTALHLFGEYFHNGHGVRRLPERAADLPAPLVARLGRGEVFNLMRDYMALGASFRWHYLVSQSVSLIANLRDGSRVVQASLAYDASEAARLQAGFAVPFGKAGEEFGGLEVGEGLTAGGGSQAFLRAVYYF